MEKANKVKEYNSKGLYLLYGKLNRFSFNEYGYIEVVLYKGTKVKPSLFVLKGATKDISRQMYDMITKDAVNRFAVKFSISTTEYKGKLFTNLLIQEIEEWKPTKINPKVREISEQNNYQNGLNLRNYSLFDLE